MPLYKTNREKERDWVRQKENWNSSHNELSCLSKITEKLANCDRYVDAWGDKTTPQFLNVDHSAPLWRNAGSAAGQQLQPCPPFLLFLFFDTQSVQNLSIDSKTNNNNTLDALMHFFVSAACWVIDSRVSHSVVSEPLAGSWQFMVIPECTTAGKKCGWDLSIWVTARGAQLGGLVMSLKYISEDGADRVNQVLHKIVAHQETFRLFMDPSCIRGTLHCIEICVNVYWCSLTQHTTGGNGCSISTHPGSVFACGCLPYKDTIFQTHFFFPTKMFVMCENSTVSRNVPLSKCNIRIIQTIAGPYGRTGRSTRVTSRLHSPFRPLLQQSQRKVAQIIYIHNSCLKL